MALLIGGCPKRQTPPRVVYIPSPPPAAAPAPAATTETLVIEEPALPEPPKPEATPEETPAPTPKPTPRRPLRTETPGAVEAPSKPAEQPTAELPALETRASPEQGAALRRQISGLQEGIKQQIAQLGRANLAGGDRKTLDDARMFLAQSERALKDGDLQRSLNLARKSSLLVVALEQGH